MFCGDQVDYFDGSIAALINLEELVPRNIRVEDRRELIPI
jgi:hypothetical protein